MPVVVRPGDCLDVMRTMPDASVHAIVTDPPYNLAFMSREWDTHATPRDFQDWCKLWAAECLRVLRPGGYLLAFGGTRTFHRLACAVEDAGFEIRDSIAWLYGCLDDQTEILVDGRWEPYRNVKQSQHALGYDVERDEFSWQPIQRVVVFPHSDTAYRLVGDHTDQLVTREHRCLVERGGAYEFCEAQEVARQRQARVPVLEDVQRLLDALPLPHPGAGGAEPDLLADVRGTSRQPSEDGAPGRQCQSVAVLPGVRQGVPSAADETAWGQAAGVLATLPREAGRGPAACRCTEGSRRLDGSVTGVLHDEDVWPRQPGMEGWGDVLAVERQLQGREVCAVPTGVRGDEPRGRVRDGAPAAGCACGGSTAAAHGGRAPRGPRPAEQRAGEPVAVWVEPRPQAVRGARFTTSDLVRVEPEHYDGIAWCVTVPTGAFVARRNGKVFVTGNSGFPKSLDVGKAIDKAKSPDVAADIEHVRGFLEAQWRRSGIKSAEVDAAFGFRGNMSAPHWFYKTSQNTVPTAEQWPTLLRLLGVALGDVPESVQAAADRVLAQRGLPGPAWALREVIGTRAVQDIRNGHGRAYGGAMFAGEDTGKIEHHVTAPATSAAREWAGWGTALKPSHEVIVVARKPLVGTVAANVQQWGCGALNIDATRAGEDGERGEGRSSQAQARGCRVHGMRGLREADGAVAVSGRAGEVADDLWPRMPQQADAGPGEPQLAGRRMDKQAGGLPVRVRCEPISGGSSADTVAATEGLPRTSLSDGADVGSAPGSRRDGASLERDQGRQPSRELAPDGLGTARQGAPADRAGTVTTSGGERSPAGCTCGGSEQVTGRWPANVVLDGSQADALDQATGDLHSAGFAQTGGTDRNGSASMFGIGNATASQVRLGDSGGASRFFHVFEPDLPTMRYQAKAPTAERPTYTTPDGRKIAHATVKPLALIRWLVRLVTPPGGTVLDPFAGSGTTVEACLIEGFDCIAIERDPESLPLIQIRIDRQAGTLPFEDVS